MAALALLTGTAHLLHPHGRQPRVGGLATRYFGSSTLARRSMPVGRVLLSPSGGIPHTERLPPWPTPARDPPRRPSRASASR